MTLSPLLFVLGAPTANGPFDSTLDLFKEGGFFMVAIVACSIVALVVIVLKLLGLARSRVVPVALSRQVESLDEAPTAGVLEQVQSTASRGESALARLCSTALSNRTRSSEETKEAVQSAAREEIVRLSMGLAVLDVVITIAPLLGLLGTASGLAVVFKELGVEGDYLDFARGIARALSTTIGGVAVAVPSVIAHSYFSRRIETMAARLEVLLGHLVAVSHRNSRAA